MIDKIIAHMLSLINLLELDLMKHYPNDLLVHDRAVLERIAVEGGKAAWVVGHTHTHLVELGIHPEMNRSVEYLGKESSTDKFFVISFGARFGTDGFEFTQISRDAFAALSKTPVPYGYAPHSERLNFKLMHGGTAAGMNMTGGRVVGHCLIKCLDAIRHTYALDIHPCAGATPLDRSALYEWASQAIVSHGTLFASWSLTVHDIEQMQQLEAA